VTREEVPLKFVTHIVTREALLCMPQFGLLLILGAAGDGDCFGRRCWPRIVEVQQMISIVFR
jgi:hypothetical protein